ncbi:MAG: type II toxin-antitoxin system VapC family toxin [Micrococcales bacterium]|nr:type II toxin-antitoxin system VapC family toxin [Micrococcales bacterium]
MKLVDTNVLVYAAYRPSKFHLDSLGWLDAALSRGEPIGFAWLALIGFVRIATNPKMTDPPFSRTAALDLVEAWLGAPSAYILEPGPRHAEFLREMLTVAGSSPNLTNDAHLAAIARQHKATVITFDSDFGQFPGINWAQPQR